MTRYTADCKNRELWKQRERKVKRKIGHPAFYNESGDYIPRVICLNCSSYNVYEYYEPIASNRRFECSDCCAHDNQCRRAKALETVKTD